jgi:hypothetical protein
MLDAHPELAVPPESHFIPSLWRDHGSSRPVDPGAIARALVATPQFGHWKIPEGAVLRRVEELDRPSFADVVEAAFLANADAHGKTRWGDKTPIYVRSIPLLARLWPEARFVHLIRDGRDVALSYLSLHWGPSTVWSAARKWRRDVSAGIRDGQPLGTSRYLEVRYEALIAEPRSTLEVVCAFAGLPFEAAMLDPAQRAGHETLAPDEGRPFHERSEGLLDPAAREWRTQMSDPDVRAFEAVAGPLLEDLGYERRFPDVGRRDRVEGVVRARGLDLVELGSDAKRALVRRFAG